MHVRAAVLLGLLTVMLGPAAQAGETDRFGVTPHPPRVDGVERRTFSIPLAGEPVEQAVRVYNRTDEPLRVSLYVANAETGPDGAIAVGFRGSARSGIGSWTNLDTDEVVLDPRSDRIVRFTVDPADGPVGLGALVVEADTTSAGTLDVVERIAVLMRGVRPSSAVPNGGVPLWPLWVLTGVLSAVMVVALIRGDRQRFVLRGAS